MKWMYHVAPRHHNGGGDGGDGERRRWSVAGWPAMAAAATVLGVIILLVGLAACANPAAEAAVDEATEDENTEEDNPVEEPPASGEEDDEEPAPLDAPRFDPAGGDFDTAPEVALSTESADAVIRFTLDASDPTDESSAYTGPIRLAPSRSPTVITARTFLDGMDASAASTQEYRIARGPTLDLAIDGNGTVTVQPDVPAYLWDEEVTLRAVPGIGAQFLEWTGAVDGSAATASLTMDTSKSVTAHFGPIHPPPGLTHSLRGGIVVNEILPDPTGTTSSIDTDGSGGAEDSDEFIELYNAGTAPIDLAGLTVWDAGYGDWFVFPPESVVEPGGVALLIAGVQQGGSLPAMAAGSRAFDAGRGGSVMNNSRDNVVISDPQTGSYLHLIYNGDGTDAPGVDYDGFPDGATVVDGVEDWGNDVDGVSLARFPDGTGTPELHNEGGDNATPGTHNASGP